MLPACRLCHRAPGCRQGGIHRVLHHLASLPLPGLSRLQPAGSQQALVQRTVSCGNQAHTVLRHSCLIRQTVLLAQTATDLSSVLQPLLLQRDIAIRRWLQCFAFAVAYIVFHRTNQVVIDGYIKQSVVSLLAWAVGMPSPASGEAWLHRLQHLS